jgi:ABC-type polysaccharide/polyol phosphate transport system ATPase subunit
MTSSSGTPIALSASGLGKTYQLGERLRLGGALTRRLRGQPLHQRPLEALADITLDVPPGTCLGIVGTNGSGKSTLLQIISNTVVPTRGSLVVRGRVLPMLSIGAAFHGELTGRENVLLQGAILGIPRRVALERVDDIMHFAGLDDHVDTPLKRYSSGMQSRLSFAIGMRFPADIYIFDEVLAVVDGAFRDTCLEEIERMARSGPTVLFVSHDLDQVTRLCDMTLWLDGGRMRELGPTGEVVARYRDHLRGRDTPAPPMPAAARRGR